MRERLFRVIAKLERDDWRYDAKLIVSLRAIAENSSPEEIDEVLEAFRNA